MRRMSKNWQLKRVRIRIHFLVDRFLPLSRSLLKPHSRTHTLTHSHSHSLTHSLTLVRHPTRSPLSDRIANARRLVTHSFYEGTPRKAITPSGYTYYSNRLSRVRVVA